jgi:hypothetical protein
MSIVLTEKRTALHLTASRILVPMANPHTQPSLFSISEALLGPQGGEVVVLHVVEANEQMDFYTTLAHTEDSLHILESSINLNLIVRLAGVLADRFGGDITFLNILPSKYTAKQKEHSSRILIACSVRRS